jgi:hypothetical protein
MRRTIAALVPILMLTFSSLLFLPTCTAYPTPSVPEFSLKFVDASYDVPTTHTIDPYTGQDVTHQGYHVKIINLVMFIGNQPLVYDYKADFLFNIQVKGHYEGNWTQLFVNDNIPSADYSAPVTSVIVGVLDEDGLYLSGRSVVIPNGGQEDFRVMGMIGGYFKAGFGHTEFSGATSDWSSTGTITIDADAPTVTVASPVPIATTPVFTSSPNPTVTTSPTVAPSELVSDDSAHLGFDVFEMVIVALLVVIAVLLVFVVFYLRKRKVS